MNTSRDERGVVGGLEGLAFGILIFVFGLFMVLNAWDVIDATMAASAAAREATRAYVEADSESEAHAQATLAATEAMAGHDHSAITVEMSPGDSYQRCEPVTATVTASVPRISLPLLGGTGGVVHVHGSHTEIVDPYRSGIDGQASCLTP